MCMQTLAAVEILFVLFARRGCNTQTRHTHTHTHTHAHKREEEVARRNMCVQTLAAIETLICTVCKTRMAHTGSTHKHRTGPCRTVGIRLWCAHTCSMKGISLVLSYVLVWWVVLRKGFLSRAMLLVSLEAAQVVAILVAPQPVAMLFPVFPLPTDCCVCACNTVTCAMTPVNRPPVASCMLIIRKHVFPFWLVIIGTAGTYVPCSPGWLLNKDHVCLPGRLRQVPFFSTHQKRKVGWFLLRRQMYGQAGRHSGLYLSSKQRWANPDVMVSDHASLQTCISQMYVHALVSGIQCNHPNALFFVSTAIAQRAFGYFPQLRTAE